MSVDTSDAALWEEYVGSPTAACRERLVTRYLPLIKYVVGRMTVSPPQGLDYEDLWSFGVFGLLDAIDRFDPHRFCRSFYAPNRYFPESLSRPRAHQSHRNLT